MLSMRKLLHKYLLRNLNQRNIMIYLFLFIASESRKSRYSIAGDILSADSEGGWSRVSEQAIKEYDKYHPLFPFVAIPMNYLEKQDTSQFTSDSNWKCTRTSRVQRKSVHE